MMDKSVLDSEHGLSNILYPTFGACDGVDEVRASTGYILHCCEVLFSVVAHY